MMKNKENNEIIEKEIETMLEKREQKIIDELIKSKIIEKAIHPISKLVIYLINNDDKTDEVEEFASKIARLKSVKVNLKLSDEKAISIKDKQIQLCENKIEIENKKINDLDEFYTRQLKEKDKQIQELEEKIRLLKLENGDPDSVITEYLELKDKIQECEKKLKEKAKEYEWEGEEIIDKVFSECFGDFDNKEEKKND